MVATEPAARRGDDTAELRTRYNQLCAALTLSAGTNSVAADRVLQELQALAQKIAFRQAERDGAGPPPPASSELPPSVKHAAQRKGNVIAFRCRVQGRTRENPRLPAALSALTDRVPATPFEVHKPAPQPAAFARPAQAKAPEPPMVAAVTKQGAELERLIQKSEDQSRILQQLEGRLHETEATAEITAEVAALRSAADRQGEQLVSLATAVHRLAKLLAAHPPRG